MCRTPLERLARPLLCGWVLTFVMGMPAQGVAWQLPARHALRRATVALAAPAGEGTYEVVLFGRSRGTADDATTPVAIRWAFDRGTRTAAASWRDERGTVMTWRRGMPMPRPAATAPTEAELVLLPRLFADADPAGLAGALGLDGERRHLALHGERVVDVLGADRGARDTPQIWLDHETHRPARIVYRSADGRFFRLDLLDWNGLLFPRRVVVSEGARPVRTYEAEPPRRRGAP